MEESEKRRERLRAMRNEAVEVDNAAANTESTSTGLCNPLLEPQTSSETPKDTRFDFYTDPMAAYATKTNKNRNSNSNSNSNAPQVSQGHVYSRPNNPDMTYPNPASRSPQERMIQSPPVQYNQSPLPTEASYAMGTSQGNPPRWGGPNAAVNYNYQQNYNSYGRGRGNRYNSPQYDMGRGRGQWQGNSRGSGSVAVEGRPHRYYKKEMVEDPWKMLRAVIWKDLDTLGSDKFRPPKYFQAKKAKVYSEHSNRSTTSASQPSLAEYLASTVNESTTEAHAHEPTM